jgi:N-acetyl-gamma-glutamyl-phosphate reductase
MLKIAIIGASGYTGGELLRLLVQHPKALITAVSSEQSAGKPITALFPNLSGHSDLVFEPLQIEKLSKKAEFFFLALPHTQAMMCATRLIEQGKSIVDLSADFRLKDPRLYQQWYKTSHTCPDLLRAAVYGLPELHRKEIQKTSLVANPGCYPTGALLGLLPLLKGSASDKKPLIQLDSIVIDAKSGVSGAGRTPALATLFPEVNESASAYNVASHRHQPEIDQEISAMASEPVHVAFSPHLLPMTRGILTTLYVRTKPHLSGLDWVRHYKNHYKNEPFVEILPPGQWPNTRNVRGSNSCHIGLTSETRGDRLIIVTAIDNLMKGAAGQAVQNMNLMLGYEETLGLEAPGLFP